MVTENVKHLNHLSGSPIKENCSLQSKLPQRKYPQQKPSRDGCHEGMKPDQTHLPKSRHDPVNGLHRNGGHGIYRNKYRAYHPQTRGRSFRPVVSGDRRGNFSRESFRQISGTGNAEILLRWIRVFILHHHNKVLILRVFHDGSINDAEIGVEKHFGLREGLEIFRGYVVHAMVQPFLTLTGCHFFMTAWDGGCPENIIRPRWFIVEKFGRPANCGQSVRAS